MELFSLCLKLFDNSLFQTLEYLFYSRINPNFGHQEVGLNVHPGAVGCPHEKN